MLVWAALWAAAVAVAEGQSRRCVGARPKGRCGRAPPNNDPGDRYYFNDAKGSCLIFRSEGCHSMTTSFSSKRECELECMPADGPNCSGGVEFHGPDGEAVVECEPKDESSCPKGGVCVYGWAFSACCNATVEAEYEAAYSKSCSNGAPALTVSNGEWNETLVGDSCRTMACPDDYTCQDIGQRFAKCCMGDLPTDPPTTATLPTDSTARPPPASTGGPRGTSTTRPPRPSTTPKASTTRPTHTC